MELLILSFVAGAMTVAAPCILPLLPVIVGGSVVSGQERARRWVRPMVIALSLSMSVILFTLLIKATTALLGVPQLVWQSISGVIVVLLGLHFIWPHIWEKLASRSYIKYNKLLGTGYRRGGLAGDIITGAALGPIFNSCSPTYALIVATILPVSFGKGLIYLVAYAVGLSLALLLVAFAGQSLINKLGWLSNPGGVFKKVIGTLFILVGVIVISGIDKKIQTYVLEKGWYAPISNFEQRLRQ